MDARLEENLKAVLAKAATLAAGFFEPPRAALPVTDLFTAVEEAKADWVAARQYFETVTDPDLIDFAIFNLEAAERRYTYLLKQARACGGTG
ncbi:MAG: hypothetical protein PWR31_421 [Bacillota bacterium]|nr:hypothetical protein [Bacillota bacterium]MDK2926731.1 hypothetical protein [Bacillota bacterium]